MKTLKPTHYNKVRPSLYLDPVDMAQFDYLRKTMFPVEASQSVFFEYIFKEFKKNNGIK